MFRTAILASALALAAFGGAQAAPRLVGGGDNAEVVYDAPSANLAGGGTAQLLGGGDDSRLIYTGPVVTAPRTGLAARLVGGGRDHQLVYGDQGTGGANLAGSPARHGG
ncbi:hypothetical protein JYK14_12250 [Siccirubricoccus sp. KC 17139]|uniref:Uncharacterized protein n=1 Tax=Siccirubricoccus soli TaxID=2899147 RepID=A0ABT1D4U2_9PROT|nr:hypothetical protein [Siccirubricoccus soli]MCO6416926.1 hypothetical protein [Siccirubricoccus soli]MCP2683061.1 hypothetical protein [Siccirubricoccus soli]